MKQWISAFFILLMSEITAAPKPPSQQSSASEQSSQIQFGANYTWVNIGPEGQESTSGNLGGLLALYEFKEPDRIYGALTGAWRQGNTDNDVGTERSLCFTDVQERIGYTFSRWCEQWMCSLFTGFGYRHYGETVTTSGNEVSFHYNELYVPLGILTSHQINASIAIGFDFIWMPQVYPTVKIDPLKGARWIITNEIANFRAEAPIVVTLSEAYRARLILQPFFEYWKDGKTIAESSVGTVLAVPENTYLFAGINISLNHTF